MIITEDIIKVGQDALVSAFGQDGYNVRYSKVVCNMHRCTDGNTLKCTDGVLRKFRRYIDVRRKNVYWCYA
jgi:hypothetical protein